MSLRRADPAKLAERAAEAPAPTALATAMARAAA